MTLDDYPRIMVLTLVAFLALCNAGNFIWLVCDWWNKSGKGYWARWTQ
jgi:hypothetical protein